MGWQDNLEEMSQIETEEKAESKSLKGIRAYLDNAIEGMADSRDCCVSHRISTGIVEKNIKDALKTFEQYDDNIDEEYSTVITAMLSGLANVTACLSKLIPPEYRSEVLEGVIQVLKTVDPVAPTNPEYLHHHGDVTTHDIEIGGRKVKFVNVNASNMGDEVPDVVKQIIEQLVDRFNEEDSTTASPKNNKKLN